MDFDNIYNESKYAIIKKIINLKPPDASGLLLNVQQTNNKKSLRFVHCDIHYNGKILALANNDAQIHVIDFGFKKCWTLEKLDSCTCIKLSEPCEEYIMVGKSSGALEVLNIDSGKPLAKLFGHSNAVMSISIGQNSLCLSASKNEAIMWDLQNFIKLQVLSLEKDCVLKIVNFIPFSNHILICYQDDVIQIWQNGNFESLKQFHPLNWKNYSVRSICFSRNGKVMVVSGYSPVLAIFHLDIWKLLKIINLPEYINTVKKVQFVPQNFDGGCNKLLAILSGNGIIHFYNIEGNNFISELKSSMEISKFCVSSTNISYISCLLKSGEVKIYDITTYTLKNVCTIEMNSQKMDVKNKPKPKLKKFIKKYKPSIETENIIEINKLKGFIKEYKEFPETFRITIWQKILQLPNNVQQYNSIVNHVTLVAFEDLYTQFPLEDKGAIQCLKHLLNNMVTWCDFFAHVTFLPYFFFPFVKVFHKKPVACFELCCTIIMNWCQHWFEYYPLPPVNILSIIDNMLMEHESELLKHYSMNNTKPVLYAWSLLETAFSEVLTNFEWLQFWDHIFINEPSFLLCAVVAFNIIQKKHLLLLKTENQFDNFFHSQNPLNIKKLINKSYHILENTSEKNHPRQYLNKFTCLTCGSYPPFDEYPKDVINFQKEQVHFLKNQLEDMNALKRAMLEEQNKYQTHSDIEIQHEEEKRMIEMEKACIQKIKTYQNTLKAQQEELKAMRQDLLSKEKNMIEYSRNSLNTQRDNTHTGTLEILMEGLDMSKQINETELAKLQELYKQQQAELLLKNLKFEEPIEINSELRNKLMDAHQQASDLKNKLLKAKEEIESPRKNKVAISVISLNMLMDKIRQEYERECNHTNYNSIKENLKLNLLEIETKSLQKEIGQLLRLLAKNKEIRPIDKIEDTNKNKTVKFQNIGN